MFVTFYWAHKLKVLYNYAAALLPIYKRGYQMRELYYR